MNIHEIADRQLTSPRLVSKKSRQPEVNKALDALLEGLSLVAAKAHLVLGEASEEQIVKEATKLSLGPKNTTC